MTRFDGRGVSVEPEAGGWTWGLEMQRYGFAGEEHAVRSAAHVSADGQRLAYDWDATLQEWYVDDTRGLEHGYTVHQRPTQDESCAADPERGPLTFTLAVRGGLRPEVQAGGRGVHFLDGNGASVLTYTGLTVLHAEGRSLSARIEQATEGLCPGVDERGARYPLTIDPIAQQAYLKASNTGGSDSFGGVSVSGDTVVVGAANEDSNATGVNGDQSDNSVPQAGAAYVFDFCPMQAAVAFRNGGSNPASYSAESVVIGATFGATVDNDLAGQLTSLLFAFDTPSSLALGGGQTLLF